MSLRRVLTARTDGAPSTAPALLRTAIRNRTCIQAVYNRLAILLAPHALYTRHGEHYVDGVVQSRDGQPPKEPKLGTFKVDGLRDLSLAAVPFLPDALFDRGAPRYGDDAVMVAPA